MDGGVEGGGAVGGGMALEVVGGRVPRVATGRDVVGGEVVG